MNSSSLKLIVQYSFNGRVIPCELITKIKSQISNYQSLQKQENDGVPKDNISQIHDFVNNFKGNDEDLNNCSLLHLAKAYLYL